MEKELLSVKGNNGQIVLFSDKIRLVRKGFYTQVNVNSGPKQPLFSPYNMEGDKEIYYSDISSIQYCRPEKRDSGFIQFAFAGGTEDKGEFSSAWGDENTVMFDSRRVQAFDIIRQELDKQVAAAKRTSDNSLTDLLELEKLGDLKTKGILSDVEFDQKKQAVIQRATKENIQPTTPEEFTALQEQINQIELEHSKPHAKNLPQVPKTPEEKRAELLTFLGILLGSPILFFGLGFMAIGALFSGMTLLWIGIIPTPILPMIVKTTPPVAIRIALFVVSCFVWIAALVADVAVFHVGHH